MNEFKKRIEYADILTDFFNDFLKENKIVNNVNSF